MSAADLGPINWGVNRLTSGHRDYFVEHLVETTDIADGPQIVLNTPGLPAIGSTWTYGNDNDPWAVCHPEWSVSPVLTHEPNDLFVVRIPFSTRPIKWCENIEDPLLEPPRLWGSFAKYMERGTKDRHGKLIANTAMEPFLGPQFDFDKSRPTLCIEMNTLLLPLGSIVPCIDTVNDAPIWGLPSPRMAKLSNMAWRRLLQGNCTFFFIITYEFDIDFKTFDIVMPDIGTRIYQGPEEDYETNKHEDKWYILSRTCDGEPKETNLDGVGGKVWNPETPEELPPTVTIEYYPESNFALDLGVPTTF